MNTIIYCFKEEEQTLVRHNFPDQSDVDECLKKLLEQEYKNYMTKNRRKPNPVFSYKRSPTKQAMVDGVLTNLVTVYLPD